MPKESIKKIEKSIHTLLNSDRRKNGLEVLRFDTGLHYLARRHSKKMASRKKIWHGNNTKLAQKYEKPYTDELIWRVFRFFLGFLIGWKSGGYSGENVAMMPLGRVKGIKKTLLTEKDLGWALERAWMKSPGHRKNIINSKFKKVGIGVHQRGKYFYATQLFYG